MTGNDRVNETPAPRGGLGSGIDNVSIGGARVMATFGDSAPRERGFQV
jgi:hypothetical protein